MFGPALIATLLNLTAPAVAQDTTLASAAPPTMQWQVRDLSVVRRVAPSYPSGVSTTDLGDVACHASVRVGGDGVPLEVAVDGCPVAFARETQRALGDWRWSAWGSVAERRVSLTIRFPTPTRAAVALPPVPAAAPAAVPVAYAPPAAPVIPSYADARAHGVPVRTAQDGIVCSAEIVRNRQGGAVKAALGACPTTYRDAAGEALKELKRQQGARGERGERRRVQDVKITFQVTDL